MRFLIHQSLRQIAVGVDAAVAEERPVGARDIDGGEVDFVDEDFLFLEAGLGDDLARRVGDEALAPELDAVPADGRFVADAIRHGDVAAIRHGMRALDGFPG